MRHKYSKLVVALVVAFLVIGCASSGVSTAGSSKGEGRDARLMNYPDSKYLTAVGLGQSEPEAKNRAVSELTRIFVSRVKTEAVDTVKSHMVDGNETVEENLFSRIQVVSDLELEGVETPEVWKEGATHYAIAVLERQKAARGWKQKIDDIDSRIDGGLNASGVQGSILLRFRALRSAASLWAERSVYMSRLNVLGFNVPDPQGYDVSSVLKELSELKSRMRLYIEVSNGGTLAEGVAEALGDSGYVMTSSRAAANVIISGTVTTKKLDIDNKDWKYARALAALTVTDVATGSIVGEVSENIRSSHVSYDEAASKAVRKLTPKVSDALIGLLSE